MSKERPILMSAPMVRAALRDVDPKTQTRRVVTPQPEGANYCRLTSDGHALFFKGRSAESPSVGQPIKCRYGSVGDRLWVRETWCLRPEGYGYRADNDPDNRPLKWGPSIHMPRAASRITLELMAVRVERLNELTEDDAAAEGIALVPGQLWRPLGSKDPMQPVTRRHTFIALWDNLNLGRGYSWESNPWVFVLSFKRVQPC